MCFINNSRYKKEFWWRCFLENWSVQRENSEIIDFDLTEKVCFDFSTFLDILKRVFVNLLDFL